MYGVHLAIKPVLLLLLLVRKRSSVGMYLQGLFGIAARETTKRVVITTAKRCAA